MLSTAHDTIQPIDCLGVLVQLHEIYDLGIRDESSG